MRVFVDFDNFSGLKKWLAELPNQTVGDPTAICETGEPYIEFQESALARPGDVEVIEREVARRMGRRLGEYLDPRKGRIYWRIPFESDIDQTNVVVRYDENGPDLDPVLDRKCVMDKNWRRITAYCRLYRANFRAMEPMARQTAA